MVLPLIIAGVVGFLIILLFVAPFLVLLFNFVGFANEVLSNQWLIWGVSVAILYFVFDRLGVLKRLKRMVK